ncbi:MAG: hypothetical protein MUF83_02045 [Acidimicrobiales bacterium]|nr:hypothetical protein [Acidimicrobiales bacterium]
MVLGNRRAGSRWRVGLVVGAAVLLGACSQPSNTPTGYDETVQANFIAACTGGGPGTSSPSTTLAGADFCGCAYDVVAANIPYDDSAKPEGYDGPTFLDIEGDLESNPSAFPQAVTDEINAECRGEDVTPTTEAPLTTEGTTPAAEGTTPGTSEG